MDEQLLKLNLLLNSQLNGLTLGEDQSGYDPEDETAGRDSQPGGQPGGGCSG